MTDIEKFQGYDEFLQELKSRIKHAQVRATVAVNQELLLLHWQIGRSILESQARLGWLISESIQFSILSKPCKLNQSSLHC
jgi:hypothetical protein